MGKASKWFRALIGLKKPDPDPNTTLKPPKKKWTFTKSHKDKDDRSVKPKPEESQNGREMENDATAVAAASASPAEAAFAVARLTGNRRTTHSTANGGSNMAARVVQVAASYGSIEAWAAITIQSHFRAYLSRRALRALRALVKLQALARGYLVRKWTANVMHVMQACLRSQARARIERKSPNSSMKSSKSKHQDPETPEKFEHVIRTRSMKNEHYSTPKRNGPNTNGEVSLNRLDDGRSINIVEIVNEKPYRIMPKRRNLFHSTHLSLGSDQICHSFSTTRDSAARFNPSYDEVQSPLKFTQEEFSFCNLDKRGPITPANSDGSRSCASGYSALPNYMAYTESSRGKVRSLSAPKQRPQYERSSSTKRYSINAYGESRVNIQSTNFTSKAYLGSGHLDRLGMPVRVVPGLGGGGHWHR